MNLAELADRDIREHGVYQALIFEGRSWDNRELLDASRKLSSVLTKLGVGLGDRVVLWLPNCPEVLIGFPAIWRLGAVAVPALPALSSGELAHILSNSGASVLLTTGDKLEQVESAVRESGQGVTVLCTDGPASNASAEDMWARMSSAEPQREVVARAIDDLAVLLYTSGTTGIPKGVMQTHGNLESAVRQVNGSRGDRQPGDVVLLVLPLAHTYGLSVLINGYMVPATCVVLRRFDPREVLETIQRFRVNTMAGVPTMYVRLLHLEGAKLFDTSSVRTWMVGGAPMALQQMAQVEALFGGRLYSGYGLTESCPTLACDRRGDESRPGSCGQVVKGVEVRIVDEEERDLPLGQSGEIIARGPNIVPGYYEMPEQTLETFRNGWLHTGDIGKLDKDGYLYILDRKKDMIIRGGLNVYPTDVEHVIHDLPEVEDCAVVGVSHPELGEEVYAFLVVKQGHSLAPQKVIAHTQEKMAKYKTPRRVVFVPELPRNNVGKIQKRALRARAEQGEFEPPDLAGKYSS